ncbi:hypothetical protein [Agrococcus jejuensis]|uniref:Uncharacterized protein n=1 Tax=Agrococcus jejuensis TaxID=399736 RepID=A0A1G8EG03_9MICO|nr:hypothetical protein [Agrococcus jejuensis]SDH68814.1 hypothetical protein SAMN04489720_2024 [Agrococcus jejuensis]
MPKSPLTVAWTMLLIACVVLVTVAAGALAVAIASPAGTVAHLDAWRGVVTSSAVLVASALALAVLTLVRIRRGESLVSTNEMPADAEALEVIVVERRRPTRV